MNVSTQRREDAKTTKNSMRKLCGTASRVLRGQVDAVLGASALKDKRLS